MNKIITSIVLGFTLGITATIFASNQESVQQFFSKNRIGSSPDYAFIKNGGHLITIHGYVSDKSVCEALANEYNGDPSLTIFPGFYVCERLN